MKKLKLLFLALLVLVVGTAFGQLDYEYSWKQNAYLEPGGKTPVSMGKPAAGFIQEPQTGRDDFMVTTTVFSAGEENGSQVNSDTYDLTGKGFPIGFAFPFGGSSFSHFFATAEGTLYLAPSDAAREYMPTSRWFNNGWSSFRNNIIAFLQGVRLNPADNYMSAPVKSNGTTTEIRYWNDQIESVNALVVDFVDFEISMEGTLGYSYTITFQIQLYENGNVVFAVKEANGTGEVGTEARNRVDLALAPVLFKDQNAFLGIYSSLSGGNDDNLFANTTGIASYTTAEGGSLVWKNQSLGYRVDGAVEGGLGIQYEAPSTDVPCSAPDGSDINYNFGMNDTYFYSDYLKGVTTADGTDPADLDSILIVMVTDETPVFTPQNGTSYYVGQAIDNGMVVFNGTVDNLMYNSSQVPASGLAGGTLYYFYCFPFNNIGCTDGPAYGSSQQVATYTTPLASAEIEEFEISGKDLQYKITAEAGQVLFAYATVKLGSNVFDKWNDNRVPQEGTAYQADDAMFTSSNNDQLKVIYSGTSMAETATFTMEEGKEYYFYAWAANDGNVYSPSSVDTVVWMDWTTAVASVDLMPTPSFRPEADRENVELSFPGATMKGYMGVMSEVNSALTDDSKTVVVGSVNPTTQDTLVFPAVPVSVEKLLLSLHFNVRGYNNGVWTEGVLAESDSILIEAKVADGEWQNVAVIDHETVLKNSTESNLKQFDAKLDITSGQSVQVRVIGLGGQQEPYYYYQLIVRKLSIAEDNNCDAPLKLLVTQITDKTASASFESDASSFEAEYQLNGAEEWTKVASIEEKAFTLDGLKPGSSYDVRVRTDCGDGLFSQWTVTSFSTLDSLPYYIDVKAAEAIPAGMASYRATETGYELVSSETWVLGVRYLPSSTDQERAFQLNTDKDGHLLRTKALYNRVSESSILSFQWTHNGYKTEGFSESDSLNVYVSTQPDFSTKTKIGTIRATELTSANANVYVPHTFNLDGIAEFETDQAVYVGFEWNTDETENAGSVIYLNFIYIGEPQCGDVTNVEIFASTTSARIAFETEAAAVILRHKVSGTEKFDSIALQNAKEWEWTGLADTTLYDYEIQPCADAAGTIPCGEAYTGTFNTKAFVCEKLSMTIDTVSYRGFRFTAPIPQGVQNGIRQVRLVSEEIDFDSIYDIYSYANQASIIGLRASTTYEVFIRLKRGQNSYGEWSQPTPPTIMTKANCPVPSLSVQNITENSAEILDNNESSLTYVRQIRVTELSLMDVWEAEEALYTLSGLEPNKTYHYAARTVCAAGDTSAWTVEADFATLPEGEDCTVPADLDTVSVSVNAAVFSVSSEILGKQLVLFTDADKTGTAHEWNTADNKEVTGLAENTLYYATVRAVCGTDTYSDWSDTLVFKTKEKGEDPQPEECGVPTGLEAVADTLSASLSWKAGENNISFVVRYKEATADEYAEVASVADSVVLEGLDALTAYVWSVRGVCSQDSSAFAADERFTTLGKELSNEAPGAMAFRVLGQRGMVHVLNPEMAYIDRVEVYAVNGTKLKDVAVRSTDNVSVPVQGQRIVLVSILSEGRKATYKVYVR